MPDAIAPIGVKTISNSIPIAVDAICIIMNNVAAGIVSCFMSNIAARNKISRHLICNSDADRVLHIIAPDEEFFDWQADFQNGFFWNEQ